MMLSPGFTGFFALTSLHSLPWVCIYQIKPLILPNLKGAHAHTFLDREGELQN